MHSRRPLLLPACSPLPVTRSLLWSQLYVLLFFPLLCFSAPSAAVRERIARAYTHRLYLINRQPAGPGTAPSCRFQVLGATGNVYEVVISNVPSCSCPDAAKGNTCKHILFVMLRVLKCRQDDPRVWQKALLNSEVQDLLQAAPEHSHASVLASRSVQQQFERLSGLETGVGGASAAAEALSSSVQRALEGDCPICFEALSTSNGDATEPVTFCKTCGNNYHRSCFDKWRGAKRHEMVTCAMCRAPWEDEGPGTSAMRISRGYLNLASYSPAHSNTTATSLEQLYPDSHMWIGRQAQSSTGRRGSRSDRRLNYMSDS